MQWAMDVVLRIRDLISRAVQGFSFRTGTRVGIVLACNA